MINFKIEKQIETIQIIISERIERKQGSVIKYLDIVPKIYSKKDRRIKGFVKKKYRFTFENVRKRKTARIIELTHQRGHQQNADTTQHRKLCRIIYCPVGALNDDAVSRNGAWREWVVHANEPILSHVPKYKRVDHARARNPESWWQIATLFFPLTRHVPPFLLFLFPFLFFACAHVSLSSRVPSIIYLAISRNPFYRRAGEIYRN